MSAIIWTNGTILTMTDGAPRVEAVLTIDERIVATGSLADVSKLAPHPVRTVDLDGATMTPGFIEAHNHMLTYGLGLTGIDATPSQLPSISRLIDAIRQRAQSTPSGGWIVARGYDDNQLQDRRHPNRHDLDHGSTRHPVFLVNGSGHLAVANTEALRRANITASTGNPQGGEIVRDEHGEATGLLLETAQRLVTATLPPPTLDD
jgi:predicted amidohydrolase YtcJ